MNHIENPIPREFSIRGMGGNLQQREGRVREWGLREIRVAEPQP